MQSKRGFVAAICLAATLLSMTSAGAADEPAGSNELATGAAEASAAAAAEDPAGGVQIVRYAGSDRYAVSIGLAQALVDAGGGTSEWVVLASGESWADAVTAGPLAASLGAPVVLVPSGGFQALSARIEFAELLRSAGVRRVMIVGSGIVLPDHKQSVLYGLGMLPRDVERLHGTDPVANAIAVAKRIGTAAEFGDLGRTVIIASGQSVADAVAVGPLAAAGPFPLLLTAPDALDPRITAYLTEHEIAHVVLVGGTAAITPAVQHAIESAGVTVTRLAGRDRAHTSRLAADLYDQHTADDPACADVSTRLGLAPAQHPEQALAAGPLLARRCTPLRYTEPDRLPADLRNTLYLARHQIETTDLLVFADVEQIPHAILRGTATSTPPFRLAFEHFVRRDGRWRPGIAVVDENRQMALHAADAGLSGFEWLSWSRDGHYLAFEASQDGTKGLFLLDTASGSYRRLTPKSQDFYFSNWAPPVWSPDGDRLAMSAYVWKYGEDRKPLNDQNNADLYVFDMNTGSVEQLTSSSELDHFRSWSPDGRHILFERTTINALPLVS